MDEDLNASQSHFQGLLQSAFPTYLNLNDEVIYFNSI